MLHKAWNSEGEMPYCFPRSSIKFQGYTGQNISDFDPNWAFPDYRPVAAFKSLRFALFCIRLHGPLAYKQLKKIRILWRRMVPVYPHTYILVYAGIYILVSGGTWRHWVSPTLSVSHKLALRNILHPITKTERLSVWLPWSSHETLKASFNVSSEYQDCHTDDLSVAV